MQENKYLATVIYPDNLETLTEDSFLIGWNTEQFHCLIAASVPQRVASNDRKLKEILEKIYHDPSYIGSRSRNVGGVVEYLPPLLLGCLIVGDNDVSVIPSNYQQQSSIWVTLKLDKGTKRDALEHEVILTKSNRLKASIRLESIYSVGFKYRSSSYLISYSAKDTDAFQCLKNFVGDDIYVSNHAANDFTSSFRGSNKVTEKVNMDLITQNINCSHDLKKFVDSYLEIEKFGNIDGRRHWTERLEESLVLLFGKIGSWFHLLGFFINNKISNFIPIMASASRHFRWSNMVALSAKSKASYRAERRRAEGEEESLTIHELSFFVYAISHRCTQLQKLLRQCSVFSLSWNVSVAARQYLFISIMEIAMEIMVDIIAGICVGIAVYASAPLIVYQSEHWATFITQRTLLETIRWFNNAPGGIKLNPMITRKMGILVEFFIKVAAKYYFACKFLILPACWLVSCLGATGFSLQVCAVIDLLRLVTWPVNLSHAIFSTVFGFLMRLLYSLWLLFNGQKKNVLRERVDTCDYDPSALLFGVMLFSVMLFAIPNFAAYHYLFVTLRLGIVLVMLLLWQVLLLIKDFPWVKLLLRIVSPSLLMEESFLEMILVREEQSPGHSKPSSTNLIMEPFDQLIQELSPRMNTMTTKHRTAQMVLSSGSNKKSLATATKNDDIRSVVIEDENASVDPSNLEDLPYVADSVSSPPLPPVDEDGLDDEPNESHDSPASSSPRTHPKSGSLHVFTFDQVDVIASGDRVSSISQENKSLRKRGDYIQSVPVSAIAIPSANDIYEDTGDGDDDRMMERRRTSSPLLHSPFQLQRDSSRSDGSKGSPKNRSTRNTVKIASPDQRATKRNSKKTHLPLSKFITDKHVTCDDAVVTIDEFPMTKYGMATGAGATVIRTGIPPSLLTPTSPLLSSSQSDRWNFSSNSQVHNISSTYFAIEQKRGRVSSIFERYLRWWSTFFVERQALLRLFWMILESRPVYLRILRAPILIKQQQDHLLDAVVLQSTQRYYASLAHGSISSSSSSSSSSLSAANNTSSSTMLTWAGLEAILAGNQSRVRPYSTRESWKDIMLLYWQMILVASQGFHDTVEQLFPTTIANEIRERIPIPDQSPKSSSHFLRAVTVEEEEKVDDSSEVSPLLTTSSEPVQSTRLMQKKIAEQVNARQMRTSRRLLLMVLGLLIVSSILSIAGVLLFGWLLMFPFDVRLHQAEVSYIQDGDHRSLHPSHFDNHTTSSIDVSNPNSDWWSTRLVEDYIYNLRPLTHEWAVRILEIYRHHVDTSLLLLSKGSFFWWTLLVPKTILPLSHDVYTYLFDMWSTITLDRRDWHS